MSTFLKFCTLSLFIINAYQAIKTAFKQDVRCIMSMPMQRVPKEDFHNERNWRFIQ